MSCGQLCGIESTHGFSPPAPLGPNPHGAGNVQEQLYHEIKPAVAGANYIVQHMREKNDYNEVGGAGFPGSRSSSGWGTWSAPPLHPSWAPEGPLPSGAAEPDTTTFQTLTLDGRAGWLADPFAFQCFPGPGAGGSDLVCGSST